MDNPITCDHNLTNFEEILVFRKKLEDFSENYKPIGGYNEEQYSKLIDFLKNLREKKFLKDEILLINTSKNKKFLNQLARLGDKNLSEESKKLITQWKKIINENKKEFFFENYSEKNPEEPKAEDPIENNHNESFYLSKIKEEKDPTKKTIQTLLFNSMNKHKMFKPHEMYKLTCEIENSLSTHYSQDKTSYEKRIKCIISNMHANSDFINKLLLGQIEISNLAIMNPEEFLSQETRQIMLKKKEDAFKSRRTDWNTLMNPGVAGIYRCGKCKCNRTTSYQVQIRRADEPMTTFITCMDCNHSWRQ